MQIFLEALEKNLRIQTTAGLLDLYQLMSLDKKILNDVAIALDNELEKTGKKSFIKSVKSGNKALQLKLDVVVAIINYKVEKEEATFAKLEEQERRAKILKAIEAKKEDQFNNLSIEELEKML